MLKRFLCIILAVMVALPVSAVANETSSADSVHTVVLANEDFKLLQALDFFDGIEESDTDKQINRGEFAREAAYLIGYDGDDAVGHLIELGILSGDTNGDIRSNDIITGSEALKILVSALGYDVFAQQSGGYPAGYYAVAGKLKIFDNGFAKTGDGLTYNDAAELLVGAGHAAVADISFSADMLRVVEGQGKTAFYLYHKILWRKGVVTANSVTDFNGSSAVRDTIAIDSVEILDENGIGFEFLGMNVIAYCRDNGDGSCSLEWIVEEENKIFTLSDTKISAIDGNLRSFRVSYYDDKYRLRSIKVEDYYPVFNGVYDTAFMPEDLLSVNGFIRFVDNDDDGTYELVDIKNHSTIVYEAVSMDEQTILDLHGRHLTLPEEEGMSRIIGVDGNAIPITELKEGMLLSVQRSRDGSYVTIYVSESSARGTVTALRDTENGRALTLSEDREFVVSGEYESLVSSDKVDIQIGQHLELLFDINGRIAHVKLIDSGDWKYGFITKCIQDNDASEPEVRLKLYTEDNAFLIYPLREKTTVDGVKRDMSNVCTYLINPEKNKIEGQIIRFIASNGVITKIDTLNPDSDPDSLTRMTELDEMSIYADSVSKVLFNGNTTVVAGNSKTVLMHVPNHSDLYSEVACFAVGNMSGLGNGTGFNGTGGLKLEAYDVNEHNIAKLVVRYQGMSNVHVLQRTSPYLIVTDLETRADENGDVRQYVTGINALTGQAYSAYVKEGLELPVLEKGDLLRYLVKNKEIVNARKDISNRYELSGSLNKFSDGTNYTVTSSSPSDVKNTYRAGLNIFQGQLYYADNENITLSIDGIEETVFGIKDSTPVYVCRESARREIETVKAGELEMFTTDACPTAVTCVIQRLGVVEFIMIYVP